MNSLWGMWRRLSWRREGRYVSAPNDVTIGNAIIAATRKMTAQLGPAFALSAWEDICQRYPNLPDGRVGYGLALMKLGRLEEAEGILADGTSRFPDDVGLDSLRPLR